MSRAKGRVTKEGSTTQKVDQDTRR